MQSEATPRRLARAATVLMIFFVASRVLGLVRDIVISHQFGTSRALDSYFAAFSIPDLVFTVLAGGALGSAFIPTFSAALVDGDVPRAWRLASSVINLVVLVLTGLCVVLAVFAPEVVAATVGRGFSSSDQQLTADLMRWMLLTPIIFGVSGIVMGILNSYQHFLLPALAPVLYNVAIIGGALLLAPVMGVYGLALGVVAGALLHLAIQIPWLVWARMRYSPVIAIDNADIQEVIRLMLPRTLGIAAVQVNFLVNTVLASGLPAGRIAALAYAWRVMLLPVGVVGQSVGTAVFPTFSAQNARKETEEFRNTFSAALRATLYLTIPATVGLVILGSPIVSLLFERGEFNSESTRQTAWALQFYALALFAHSSLEILTRAFYAMHDTLTPVVIGLGAMMANIALSFALISPLKQGGLALANSIATLAEALILLVILYRRLGGVGVLGFALSLSRFGIAALAMGLVLGAFSVMSGEASSFYLVVMGMAIGGTVYVGATLLMRSEEASFLLRKALRRP